MAFEQQGLPGMGIDGVLDEPSSTAETSSEPVQEMHDPAQLEMELVGIAEIGGTHD